MDFDMGILDFILNWKSETYNFCWNMSASKDYFYTGDNLLPIMLRVGLLLNK